MQNEAVKTPKMTEGEREAKMLELEKRRDWFEGHVSEALADVRSWRTEIETIEAELEQLRPVLVSEAMDIAAEFASKLPDPSAAGTLAAVIVRRLSGVPTGDAEGIMRGILAEVELG